jgi:glucose-6-phosphate 1-dehydrogenase
MRTSHSDALVIFGATGDLAHKMIFPTLYASEVWTRACYRRRPTRLPVVCRTKSSDDWVYQVNSPGEFHSPGCAGK